MGTAGLCLKGSEVVSTGMGLGCLLALKTPGTCFHKIISSSNSHILHTSKSLTRRQQHCVGRAQAQRPKGSGICQDPSKGGSLRCNKCQAWTGSQ